MSTRRRARRQPVDAGQLPPRLAAGPCIEDWATEDDPAEAIAREAGYPVVKFPAHEARRAWLAAVAEWAESVGFPGTRWEAARMARVGYPWSREFLIAEGRADWVAYYEGRGPKPSTDLDHGSEGSRESPGLDPTPPVR